MGGLQGEYTLSMIWTSGSNRSKNVDVNITVGDKHQLVHIDQTKDGGQWNILEKLFVSNSEKITIEIKNSNSNGYVVADAVKLTSNFGNDIIIDNDDLDNMVFKNSYDGPDLVSYARVYYSPFTKGKYMMTFMGQLNAKLRIFFAYSNNAKDFIIDKAMIISSDVNDSENVSGAFYLKKDNKYFIYYHDSLGVIYERQIDSDLNLVSKSRVFFDYNNTRIAAPFFIENEDKKLLMFFDYGLAGKTDIRFAREN